MLQFSQKFLSENGVPPQDSDFHERFKGFDVAQTDDMIHSLIGMADKHQHW